ncbi:hypothetical protein V2J09_002508 [Rumex salicifolius]
MATRIQNSTDKNLDQGSVQSMSQLYMNYPSHWNSHEHQISDSLSKSLSLKVNFSAELCNKAKNPGLQMPDDSSSSQSTQSNHDLTGAGRTNSQDNCNSSESGQDVSCDKRVESQIKHVFMMGQSDVAINQHQASYGPMMTCLPYACADPYFTGGLATAYGATTIIQPQIGGGPARVPLPLDFTEDGPIYVNAKQYHGILRRRQSRAKLEAQNMLIKARKPYLHESRHIHAMNRVRGSGGRFLSTKKLQQEAAPSKASGYPNLVQYRQQEYNGSSSSSAPSPHLSFNFTDLSNGGGYSGFEHCARVVRLCFSLDG